MSTGKGNIYEIVNKPDDNIYVLDEIVHYLETFPPKEVILDYAENYHRYMEENGHIYNFTTNEILSYIGLDDINKYSSRNFKMIKKAFINKIYLMKFLIIIVKLILLKI